jgi:hypothetical protein
MFAWRRCHKSFSLVIHQLIGAHYIKQNLNSSRFHTSADSLNLAFGVRNAEL